MGSGGRAAVSRTALSPEISIVDGRFRPPGAARRRPADRTPVSPCWIHVAPDGAAGFGLHVFRRPMGKMPIRTARPLTCYLAWAICGSGGWRGLPTISGAGAILMLDDAGGNPRSQRLRS